MVGGMVAVVSGLMSYNRILTELSLFLVSYVWLVAVIGLVDDR